MPHRLAAATAARPLATAVVLAAASLLAGMAPARAECPSDQAVAALAEKIAARQPAESYGLGLSVADGLCAQEKLVGMLKASLGPVVGYKAGLTNTAVQQRFGVPHPVRGTLLAGMILKDGATVDPAFGAAPLFESDLIVTVKDPGIHGAKGHVEILRHLESVVPFLELPDLVLAKGAHMDGGVLTAINVGARLGVTGTPIPVEASQDFADRLAKMTVVLSDDSGREIARSPGTAILGHPLDAVAWLVEDLGRAGITLKAGDMLSLGSFSPLSPPAPGRTVTARYEGLAGLPVEVKATFK
ncbi:MAG: fumarylacetoacetate hydrolase [Rhodovulum sp.]|nr:fumarylacetoacetate hydrolase [Rhodovulum sp.]